MPSESMLWDTGVSPNIYDFIWEIKSLGTTQLPTLYAGATLPVNITLFYGAAGSTKYKYQWQTNSSGEITTYDSTAAVKKVTQDACAKLKSDHGSNLRVYLIKFRKQDKYLHKITKTETDFDYSYLNNCATGTSAPYMYDITTEAELNSALSAIYTNIKDWAGRTEAKNVGN